MTDYQGNSKKAKEQKAKPEKAPVEKVVVGTVIVKKKSLTEKFKDIFFDKTFVTTMATHVVKDIIVPNGKNLIYDAGREVLGLAVYRSGNPRGVLDARNIVSRFSYNSPVQRVGPPPGYSPYPATAVGHSAPPIAIGPRRFARTGSERYILSTREEASSVLEHMGDFIETYGVASILDLHELLGQPTDPVANKWGWLDLRDVQIHQTPEGFMINFPPAEPIQ